METSKEVESNEVSNNGEDKFVENKELEKRLLRKIDLRIMPLITLLYLLSFLDRVNIGNAKLANIDGDLKLVGNQFNWCLSIFFIGYILFEIPSNFMLVRTNPSVWIPFIMISWGIVMTLMAFVTNFSGLMVARFFLGVCEAGFFPGAIYYISTWYKRSETNSRIAILAVGPSFAGSFSGLLAFGILKSLNGKSNLKGWRWLFLIEGLMTIAVSIVSYFFLSNYPEKAMWLSEEERKYAVERLKHDEGKAHVTHYNKKHVYAALTDWKVYLSMLYLGLSSVSFYSYALFIPSIVHGMGFDFVKSQLMSVPPFFCAGISAIIVAVLSDRRIVRFPFIIICLFFGIIGYILLAIPSVGKPGKYVGTCIVGAGLFPATITAISWITNNIAGHAKRSISSAMIMMCANVGGAIASQIYRQQDAPRYVFGNSMSMGFLAASACVSILQYFVFKTLNKKKRENPQSFLKGKTEEEIKNMGDLHPEFIYNL